MRVKDNKKYNQDITLYSNQERTPSGVPYFSNPKKKYIVCYKCKKVKSCFDFWKGKVVCLSCQDKIKKFHRNKTKSKKKDIQLCWCCKMFKEVGYDDKPVIVCLDCIKSYAKDLLKPVKYIESEFEQDYIQQAMILISQGMTNYQILNTGITARQLKKALEKLEVKK